MTIWWAYSLNDGWAASRNATALPAMTCSRGPPCQPGNTALSIAVACSAVDRMQPPRGPRSVLCVVNVTTSANGTGSGWAPPAISPAMWARVEQEQRADLVGDRPERLGIEPARVARRAGDDHLRAVLEGEVAHLVHVDALVARRDLVGDEPVEQAAGVDRRAVGEVTAVVEAEPEHGVAGLEQRLVHAHVGVGTGVRLDVGVLGAEQRLGPLDGQRLDVVDDGVAAVVALARVALGVLVRQHRPDGAQHRRRGEVLAGDQLQPGGLALELAGEQGLDLGVGFGVGWGTAWRAPVWQRAGRSELGFEVGDLGDAAGVAAALEVGGEERGAGSPRRARRRRRGPRSTARWRRCGRAPCAPCTGRCTARPARRAPCWRRAARPGRCRR